MDLRHLLASSLLFLLGVPVWGQGISDEATQAARISQAIRGLGDRRFIVRQQASETLWQAGREAQTALEKATGSLDREVAYRAQAILDKFRYGIYADTPPEIVDLIRSFRDGDLNAKKNVLRNLLEQSHTSTIVTLIRAEWEAPSRDILLEWAIRDIDRLMSESMYRGHHDDVEPLLEMASHGPSGLAPYVTFLAVTERLDAKINELRESLITRPSSVQTMRLAMMLRARGDLSDAIEIARMDQQNNPQLLQNLLFEANQWPELSDRLDLEFRRNTLRHGDIQFLGTAACVHMLANRMTRYQQVNEALRGITNERMLSHQSEALLISGDIERGLEVMKPRNALNVFKILSRQGRYHQALKAIGISDFQEGLDKWIQETVAQVNSSSRISESFNIAMEMATTLVLLGQEDRAKKLLDDLAQEAKNGSDSRRGQLLIICGQDMELMFYDQAFKHARLALTDETSASVIQRLFSEQFDSARTLWNRLREENPAQDRGETLEQLRELFRVGLTERMPLEAVQQFVNRFQPADDATRTAFVDLFLAQGYRQEAYQVLEQLAPENVELAARYGDLLAEDQSWAAAARWYDAAFQLDRNRPTNLYLKGIAQQRAGDLKAGQASLDLAHQLSLTAQNRYLVAANLRERGYTQQARREWELILRTGEFDEWYVGYAAQFLGNEVVESQPLLAAGYWQSLLFGWLKTSNVLSEVHWYTQLPYLVHKSRAIGFARQGDLKLAGLESQRAFQANPGNIQLPEDLVPLLDEKGATDAANQLFESVYQVNERILQEFPNSASHLNNLAWMAARCNRRLEDAFRMSSQSVALEPENPTYLDTLAEVEYRRGNREKAIEYSKKSLIYKPNDEHYQQQLKRFQAGK